MPHAPTATDVEELSHVAQDADGVPLSNEDLTFFSSDQDVLRIDDAGDLFVVGIAQVRHYPAARVREAIADGREVWTCIAAVSTPDARRAGDF